jgi:hypothetical protein
VASAKSLHDSIIKPLEDRVSHRTGQPKALSQGAAKNEAVDALKTEIDWNATIQNFRDADTAQNTPGGVIDTNDMNSPTFQRDLGPATIGGVAFAHYVAMPGEALPPAPAPAPPAPAPPAH